jgi:hypothetical protein
MNEVHVSALTQHTLLALLQLSQRHSNPNRCSNAMQYTALPLCQPQKKWAHYYNNGNTR